MPLAVSSLPWSAEVFAEFQSARREPAWLSAQRRDAWSAYREQLREPLDPEEYKRIDLRAFRPDKFALAPAGQALPTATLMQHCGDYAGNVSHVDGHCTQETLLPQLRERGVIFCGLSRFVQDHSDRAQAVLGTAVSPNADRFAAWQSAFWTGGTVLYVPRNVEVEQPLHSLIALATDGAADFSRTLVILEEGASATLLEETASSNPDAAGLHVGAVELLLAPRSQLRYVQLQNWNDKVWHIAHQAGRVARDAALQWTVGALGSRLSHIHQDVHLDGQGASAQVNGVTFATGKQLISYYTQQGHHAPNTTSDLLYKDVVRDRARVVWRGMIKVDHEAQKTDGYQRNDALLMSDDCRADLIPGLEIEADDVRCTHGATAGRVDEEQLFYCMCRGLNRSEAMHMIVEGFFQRVYDRIPVELVRETLSQAVQQKLGLGG